MRRYIPVNFPNIRQKAKLLHRCLELMSDDTLSSGVIRGSIPLTRCQLELATALGYASWAEMKTHVEKMSTDKAPSLNQAVPVEMMFSMASSLQKVVYSRSLAVSLILRLGFVPDCDRIPVVVGELRDMNPVDWARAVDFTVERLMEVGPRTPEALVLMNYLDDLTTVVPQGSGYNWYRGGSVVDTLLTWVRTAAGIVKRGEGRGYVDPAEISRLAPAIPIKGLFAMGGSSGTGKSHAGVTLAEALRGNRRVVYSIAAVLGCSRHSANLPGSVVVFDEMTSREMFEIAARIAEHSVVVFSANGSSPATIEDRFRDVAIEGCGRDARWWKDHYIGGVHFTQCHKPTVHFKAEPFRRVGTFLPPDIFFVDQNKKVFDGFDGYLAKLTEQLFAQKRSELIWVDTAGVENVALESPTMDALHSQISAAFEENTVDSPEWRGDALHDAVVQAIIAVATSASKNAE